MAGDDPCTDLSRDRSKAGSPHGTERDTRSSGEGIYPGWLTSQGSSGTLETCVVRLITQRYTAVPCVLDRSVTAGTHGRSAACSRPIIRQRAVDRATGKGGSAWRSGFKIG